MTKLADIKMHSIQQYADVRWLVVKPEGAACSK